MAVDSRTRGRLPSPGPFLAEITNHLDPSYMGSLEVVLMQGVTNPFNSTSAALQGGTYIVKYLSPFSGATSIRWEGNNPASYNEVQKSYGFWMVPPDIGTVVMVIFVDGDPNQGYWFGCVQDTFQNHMVPGIAASEYVALTPEQKRKYGTNYLPVAEFNKGDQKLKKSNIHTTPKPVHPFADRLLEQGLLLDAIRGVTSSSARREVPSGVFGISTPGPLDPDGPKARIGYSGDRRAPVSRLGGSTFVMDDGDVDGQNELVRIRTRTGHQILMHNTKDLIYIANSKGTAWIELTGNGKIDIYAQDSVSIHSEKDFNFLANGNINFEAGGNFNIKSGGEFKMEAVGNFSLSVNRDGFITVGQNLEVNSTSNNNFTAGGSTNIKSGGQHLESASQIHMNGPAAATAATATPIPTNNLPNTNVSAGWSGNQYQTDDMVTIVSRAPTHEPYAQHESIALGQGTTTTDAGTGTGAAASVPISYNRPADVAGTPPTTTGDAETDNIAAFLWMIRCCEGTSGPNGYRTMFTGKLFDVDDPNLSTYKYADHPRIANSSYIGGKPITSTAAGAYQFLTTTWDECKKATGVTDFSPESQDKGCIYLIKRRQALDDVKAGRFEQAVVKCKTIWASLPGSPYGQNPKGYDVALNYYKQGGGQVAA